MNTVVSPGERSHLKTYKMKKNVIKIPGLSFSWKRALGVTKVKQQIARKTGIPTSKAGIERKVGRSLLNLIFK